MEITKRQATIESITPGRDGNSDSVRLGLKLTTMVSLSELSQLMGAGLESSPDECALELSHSFYQLREKGLGAGEVFDGDGFNTWELRYPDIQEVKFDALFKFLHFSRDRATGHFTLASEMKNFSARFLRGRKAALTFTIFLEDPVDMVVEHLVNSVKKNIEIDIWDPQSELDFEEKADA